MTRMNTVTTVAGVFNIGESIRFKHWLDESQICSGTIISFYGPDSDGDNYAQITSGHSVNIKRLEHTDSSN